MKNWTGKFKIMSAFVGLLSFVLITGIATQPRPACARDDDHVEKLRATPSNTGAVVKRHADLFLRIPGAGEYGAEMTTSRIRTPGPSSERKTS